MAPLDRAENLLRGQGGWKEIWRSGDRERERERGHNRRVMGLCREEKIRDSVWQEHDDEKVMHRV